LAEFVDSVTQIGPELSGKRLELLKEVVPKLRRNTVLSNPGNTVVVLSLQRTWTAAKRLDLSVESIDVREPRELGRAFSIIVEKPRWTRFVAPSILRGTVRTRTQGRGAR